MTESSFPIVDKKLSDAAWAQTVGAASNGVLDDWGDPYAIVVNTNDTVTVKRSSRTGIARAVVNGFGHQIDADVTLPVPAVTTATVYHVGLLYSPSNAADPVKLSVLKGATPPLTTGQVFMPLYMYERGAGQTLAAAKAYDIRPTVQTTLTVPKQESVLAMSPLLFLRNTNVYCAETRRTFRAQGSVAAPSWVGGPMQGYWRGTRATAMANANRSAILGFTVASTENDSWMSMADNGVFTLDPGIYDITATMTLPQKATGRCFVDIGTTDPNAEPFARGPFTAGEDRAAVSFPIRLGTKTDFRVYGFQTTGRQLAPTFTLNIARIS